MTNMSMIMTEVTQNYSAGVDFLTGPPYYVPRLKCENSSFEQSANKFLQIIQRALERSALQASILPRYLCITTC